MDNIVCNNDEHNLPQRMYCEKCSGDMKLELLENKVGEVAYRYQCKWFKCGYTYDILGAE